MIAALALLVKDSDNLMLGQNLTITASHETEKLLKTPLPPDRWITSVWLTPNRLC